ncbi:MAG: hypothetical protein J0I28_06610, partial [Caulobacterales bacterium]|nr:hypothetical protein [Caulobacterales bacterium]
MADFNGGSGNDVYTGGVDADIIAGGGGNDTLNGAGGFDTISGDAGADVLDGGDGDDWLYSGVKSPYFNLPYSGNPFTPPVMDRGTEVDSLFGGAGSDRLFAGYGDTVDGGSDGFVGDYLYLSLQGASSGVAADFNQTTLSLGGGTITGIENVSWVEGSNFNDVITDRAGVGTGYAGFPTLWGMGGDDLITAGYYTGSMFGGDGADTLDGRPGTYSPDLYGGDGADILYSGGGGDSYGDGGDDTIYQGGGTAWGGAGADLIIQSASSYLNKAYGDEGDDEIRGAESGYSGAELIGGDGADKLTGTASVDRLISSKIVASDTYGEPDRTADMGLEHDQLFGLGGNDLLFAGYGDDVDGGTGSDALSLSLGGMTSGATFSTAGIVAGQAVTLGGGVIQGVEILTYLRGSEFNDTLTLATQSTAIAVDGGAGNDVIVAGGSVVNALGGAGDDRFVSGSANDTFDGGAGTDAAAYSGARANYTIVRSSSGYVTVSGAEGADSLTNVEQLVFADQTVVVSSLELMGTEGTDYISGAAVADIVRGLGGGDQINGQGGDDLLDGGAGIDWLWGDAGADRLLGGAGDDMLDGGDGDDVLIGGVGDDNLSGGAGFDIAEFTGNRADYEIANLGSGTIRVQGPDGIDRLTRIEQIKFADQTVDATNLPLTGGSGNDTIYGSEGPDTIQGLGGADNLNGNDGDDLLIGGAGNDSLDGGAGTNTAEFSGPLSSYTIRRSGGNFGSVTGPDGVDSFVRVAILKFADTVVMVADLPITGTTGNDFFIGSTNSDRIFGLQGDDTIQGEAGGDQLDGGGGADTLVGGVGADMLTGGAGNDTFRDTAAGLNGDRITDFSLGDRIVITNASLSGFSASLSGSTLTYTGGSLTLDNLPSGARVLSRAASGGGVELYLAATSVPGAFNADFNGDGRSDVFWRNDNGGISSWLGQAGGGFVGDSTIGGVAPTDWKVIGVGDFNGDGKSDLFWRNDNATVASWLGQAGGGFTGDTTVG